MYRTKVGVDLTKKAIQVCIYKDKKVLPNVEMTPDKFLCWLINAKPATIIFEACGTSNYWLQRAIEAGHDACIICAKWVSTVRQNQKTDKNDALAIIEAALLLDINFISGKSVEQQQLQSIQRLRELAIKQRDATKKQIIALLLELNFCSSNNSASMIGKLEDILEDAENGLSAALRQALNTAKEQFECMVKAIATHDRCLEQSIQPHHDYKKWLKLEGVFPINAVNLYISLGCA
jgi:transposase